MEISLLLVLVLIVGAGSSGSETLGRLFGTYRKVSDARQRLRRSFNPLNYLRPPGKDDSRKPPEA